MPQMLFEKLELLDEKNVLIQGLPSTIEKQFSKLSFSKNVTQLLRSRKIDFALVFALNIKHLNKILEELYPAIHDQTKLWIAFPKQTSKIASDLNRNTSWSCMTEKGYEATEKVVLDYVWSAQRFEKPECRKSSKVVSLKNEEKLAKAEGF